MEQSNVTYRVVRTHEALPLNQIARFKGQPRVFFDPKELAELTSSMQVMGQSDLVKVVKFETAGRPYLLVDGERRYRSAKSGRLQSLIAIEIELVATGKAATLPFEKQLYILAAGSNTPKAGYKPLEFARILLNVQESLELGMNGLARRFSVDDQTVKNHLALLTLCPKVLLLMEPDLPEERILKMTLALLLVGYPEKVQVNMALTAIEKKWTARELSFHLKELSLKKGIERVGKRPRKPSDDRRLLERGIGAIDERLLSMSAISPDNLEALVIGLGTRGRKNLVADFNRSARMLTEIAEQIAAVSIR
jgi:ParB-like chromosome segregation protein Spo0J